MTSLALASDLDAVVEHWKYVAPLLEAPTTEADFEVLVAVLDKVLDAGGADENHPLSRLASLIGDAIEAYELDAYPMPSEADGVDVLQHLIEVHGIKQSELPEVGSQSVISEILARKRQLNLRQVTALATRFGLPMENFVPSEARRLGVQNLSDRDGPLSPQED